MDEQVKLVKARALQHLGAWAPGRVDMIPERYVAAGMAELVDDEPEAPAAPAAKPKRGAKGSIVEADLVKADDPEPVEAVEA